jgi:diguanylate cyclase (GGDEF)-like protein
LGEVGDRETDKQEVDWNEFSTRLSGLERECNLAISSREMNDSDMKTQNGENNVIAINRRHIVMLSEKDDKEVSDLADQLGFFGFTVDRVFTLKEFKKVILSISDSMGIIHTFILDKDPKAQKELSELKKSGRENIHYLFISERGDFSVRIRALRSGGDAFFFIPLDLARIVDMIDSLSDKEEREPFHVLIVDDDPDQISYYALVLQQAGMITSVASDPRTVMDVIVESKPELILMDLYMPGCTGTELLAIIRQQEAFVSIPVVFLSVEEQENKKIAAVQMGGDDFITKPVDPDFLIASITNRIVRTRDIRYFMERDSLTGLLNHSNLKEQLLRETLRAERTGSDLCFGMIDIDLFKKVNDTHGHLTGDKVLKSLSRMLTERLRRTDIIGRYGGEEFGIILLNTTSEHAFRIMDEIRDNFFRIRHQSEKSDFFVSFSCGIACTKAFKDANRLTGAADKALYQAKENGRNRIEISKNPDPPV